MNIHRNNNLNVDNIFDRFAKKETEIEREEIGFSSISKFNLLYLTSKINFIFMITCKNYL